MNLTFDGDVIDAPDEDILELIRMCLVVAPILDTVNFNQANLDEFLVCTVKRIGQPFDADARPSIDIEIWDKRSVGKNACLFMVEVNYETRLPIGSGKLIYSHVQVCTDVVLPKLRKATVLQSLAEL
ncbi:MAG: hypothetical protein AB7L09_02420 [Nitrospira sp.]